MGKIYKNVLSLLRLCVRLMQGRISGPLYKLMDISESENGYVASIKVINKNIFIAMKPEEILADNNLVDQFAPRDIRTLTYLGYLGINSPKYEVLAKRLLADESMVFVLKQNGVGKTIVRSASDIINSNEIIQNLSSVDAKTIGYIVGIENALAEKKQKNNLLKPINSV